jgi:hypothetical protein
MFSTSILTVVQAPDRLPKKHLRWHCNSIHYNVPPSVILVPNSRNYSMERQSQTHSVSQLDPGRSLSPSE